MTSVSTGPTNAYPGALPASDLLDDDDAALRAQALVVVIAGNAYGIPVSQAREVVRAPRVTRVPGAPAEVLGVVNVRGAVVTVLDPAAILHSERAVPGASIVLLEHGSRLAGLAVDAVRDVRTLDQEADRLRGAEPVTPLDAAALCAWLLISDEEMGR